MKRSGANRSAAVHYTVIHFLYWPTLVAYNVFGAAYLYNIGLSSSVAGLVMAISGLLSAIIQPLLGAYADRSKTVSTGMLATRLVIPAAALLLIQWLVPLPLAARVVLYGCTWALLYSVHFLINSCAMECAEFEVPVNYGASRAMGSMSYALSSYGVGLLVARAGLSITIPIAAGVSVVLAVVLNRWRLPARGLVAAPTAEEGAPVPSGSFFKRYPRFLVFVIGAFFVFAAYNMMCRYLIEIVGRLGGSSKELGTVTMVSALSEIPTILFSMALVRKFGCRLLMRISALMLSVEVLLMSVVPSIGALYAVMTLQSLSYSLYAPVSVYYVNARMARCDKVKGQSIMTFMGTVASAAGVLLGGFLLDTTGLANMMLLCTVACFAGCIVMIAGTERV